MPPDPTARPITIRPENPDCPQALTCLAAYFRLLCDNIPSFTPAHFPLPDPQAETYRPPQGQFLIALCDDVPLGCVSLRAHSPGVGEVKRLWVAPAARGHGLARRLMIEIESQARIAGLHTLKLDTNETLPAAIALYHATGWADTAPYSPFPATHWFVKRL